MVTTRDVPPNDRKGSGTPVTGSMPVTAPMLTSACPTTQAVIPVAIRVPNRSGARRAARMPRTAKAPNRREHEQGADQPQLLADDGEDEVGVGVGQEAPLGPAGAQADPRHVPGAERDQRLGDLVAGVGQVPPGVDEPEHPVAAVAGAHGQHGGPGGRGEEDRSHADERHLGHEQHHQDDEDQDHGRPHVGLEHHQSAEGAGHHDHRPQGEPGLVHLVGPATEQGGDVDEQGELGHLRRLEPEPADAQPPG